MFKRQRLQSAVRRAKLSLETVLLRMLVLAKAMSKRLSRSFALPLELWIVA
jgi:hypothetical protein